MTVPPGLKAATKKVSDLVREMVPIFRQRLTKEESDLAVHLRGNVRLYESLSRVIRVRLEARSMVPEPADPIFCKSMLARDRELQWLLSRLELIHKSPVDSGEPPEE